ncbi:HU family DNA-binding protein [uncultured Parabacteroides sp.]|uniref:HU family DNA-binding protein n=1 Tax=uncultured Parabacteroides sp. TaxID=512312 RepID=UPI00259BEEB3|nr:HU family DNA-binding protein [uncultured Parabacteroides sp.]
MTKKQLVSYLAKHCSLPLATSRLVVNTLADVATKELKAGRGFSIHGFGSLEPWYQSARPGRNIRAELPCMIAPRISVKFKPGVYLLAALNNNVLAEDNPDTVEEEAVAHTDQHHFRFPHKERGDSEGAGRE